MCIRDRPCPAGIEINQCARMSLMLRRAPAQAWLTEEWQARKMCIRDRRRALRRFSNGRRKPMNKKTRAMALILVVVMIVSLLASMVIPFLV